jgi:hypothetical protein
MSTGRTTRYDRGAARRFFVSLALTVALCYLPLLLWAPRELVANLVLFSLLRPTNSSSVRAYLPESLAGLVGVAQIALVLFLLWRLYRMPRPIELPAVLRSAALVLIAFVAFNKVVHGNYLVWLQPFLALTVAGMPFRQPGLTPAVET